jgi:DnaK suppressor protein
MARRDALLRLNKSLLARRAALRHTLAGELENLGRFGSDLTGDSADGAFDSGSGEISSQLVELEARELNQIERALTRLKRGEYGICELCQEKIPVARLNALPYSTTCINCQREMEDLPAGESRWGNEDWDKLYDGNPAMEEQLELDPAKVEVDRADDH